MAMDVTKMYYNGNTEDMDALLEDNRRVKPKDPSKKKVRKDSYISANKKAARRVASTEAKDEY